MGIDCSKNIDESNYDVYQNSDFVTFHKTDTIHTLHRSHEIFGRHVLKSNDFSNTTDHTGEVKLIRNGSDSYFKLNVTRNN